MAPGGDHAGIGKAVGFWDGATYLPEIDESLRTLSELFSQQGAGMRVFLDIESARPRPLRGTDAKHLVAEALARLIPRIHA
jgi:hypothetical protein